MNGNCRDEQGVKVLGCSLSLQDLDPDNLSRILAHQDLFTIRTLSKAIKDRIENSRLISSIRLSAQGSTEATASFFECFESQTIADHHSWNASTGWFRSYLNAVRSGLNPDNKLCFDVDDSNLHTLSDGLASTLQFRGANLRIRCLCLHVRCGCRDLKTSFALLSGLQDSARRVELRLEFTRRPPLSLLTITQDLTNLPESFSVVELAVRCCTTAHPSQ